MPPLFTHLIQIAKRKLCIICNTNANILFGFFENDGKLTSSPHSGHMLKFSQESECVS